MDAAADLPVDLDRVACELLTALRGRRSQLAWSRRLGYHSNVAYAWESGRRSPTAAETLRAAARAGVELRARLGAFLGSPPPWLTELDPATPAAVAQLLLTLRGNVTTTALARRAGLSRLSVQRWLAGQTEPRLGDFLRLVQAASLRAVDFVAALVDPALLPSIAPLWAQLDARRRGAFDLPWTQAVLRAMELQDYVQLPTHQPGWIAARLAISPVEEARCIEVLAASGQATWTGTHYRPAVLTVDTRGGPELSRRIKSHWTQVAKERIDAAAPGQFSYNVFVVSDVDFERIRELQRAYFQAIRSIVAESEPGERVAVVNVQLFALDGAGPRSDVTPPTAPAR